MPSRFQAFATKRGEALALVDPDGRTWTRAQLAERVNLLSQALQGRGHGTGTVMAFVAPNSAEFTIAYLAAMQLGMYVVPINWHLAASEIRYILEDSEASILMVHARFETAIEAALRGIAVKPQTRISLGGEIPDFLSFGQYTSGYRADPIAAPTQGRVLSYTSATTGRPKGVKLPLHDAARTLDLSIEMRVRAGTFPEEHTQLFACMLYHGAPLEGVIVALHMGHAVILMEHFDPEEVLRQIDKHKVTVAYVVPSMFLKLLALDVAVSGKYSTASLEKIVHLGSTCPIEVKRRMIDWWGPIFWEIYGATEGSGTVVNSQDWLKYPGTVGRPIPGTRVRIVDNDGHELPSYAIGMVYLTRYSGDRFEYLNDPGKTAAAYRGEFFTVGDLGYLNDDGYLFLCDRVTDVINRSGAKVYPAEIEGHILENVGVADCAVVGIPDPRFGEAILAVIQSAMPSENYLPLKRQIVRRLADRVSMFKIPTHFEFVERIPRDATGKVSKKLLREKYSSSR